VGVKKGDAVSIYMPMVAELPVAMLACARIGAVHSVVFAGFSAESLAQRIDDCRCDVLLTCNGARVCVSADYRQTSDGSGVLKPVCHDRIWLACLLKSCRAAHHQFARPLPTEVLPG